MNKIQIDKIINKQNYGIIFKLDGQDIEYNPSNQQIIEVAINNNTPNITLLQDGNRHDITFDYNINEQLPNTIYIYQKTSPSVNSIIYPKLIGYCGLTNIGNSCFMNASIQLLYSIPILRWFFESIKYEDINNFTKVKYGYIETYLTRMIPITKIILQQLHKLFKEIRENIGKTLNIKSIYTILMINTIIMNDESAMGQQHDPFLIIGPIINSFRFFNETLDIFISFCSKDRSLHNNEMTLSTLSYTLQLHPQKLSYSKVEISVQDLINISFEPTETDTGEFRTYFFEPQEKTNTIIIDMMRMNADSTKMFTKVITNKYITINKTRFIRKGIIIHLGPTNNAGHYIYLSFDDNGDEEYIISDDIIKPAKESRYYNTYQENTRLYYYNRVQ